MVQIIRKQYYKPEEICVQLAPDQKRMFKDANLFVNWMHITTNEILEDIGMVVRTAEFADLPAVRAFNDRYFPRLEGNELRSYDYYQLIQFGTILILEKGAEIIGVAFELGLDTAERTSYVRRLLVSPLYRGTKASQVLTDSICVWAHIRGSQVLRSVIALQNKVSLFYLMNRVGLMIEELNPKIEGLTRYYNAFIPATPRGLMGNKIDRSRLNQYIQDKKEGEDYLLLSMDNPDRIEKVLIQKEHLLVSLRIDLKRGYEFVALPKSQLIFE